RCEYLGSLQIKERGARAGDDVFGEGYSSALSSRTMRNPSHGSAEFEGPESRAPQLQKFGGRSNAPPRRTRSGPFAGPVGSTPTDGTGLHQSRHHSRTFPCMSKRPKLFGSSCATLCRTIPEFPLCHMIWFAWAPGGLNGASLPAWQAYSHCASVGSA